MYNFDEFEKIIRELRDKCPWDSVQTHESLKECLYNETREVLDAIDELQSTGKGNHLCEELGDVLMNILLQCVIAEEEGIFTLEDVIDRIARKMVFRHPRIFAPDDEELNSLSWKELKQREKEMQNS